MLYLRPDILTFLYKCVFTGQYVCMPREYNDVEKWQHQELCFICHHGKEKKNPLSTLRCCPLLVYELIHTGHTYIFIYVSELSTETMSRGRKRRKKLLVTCMEEGKRHMWKYCFLVIQIAPTKKHTNISDRNFFLSFQEFCKM